MNVNGTEGNSAKIDDKIMENQELLSARRIKWFSRKFERDAEAKSKTYIGDKGRVEYLGGVEGVTVGSDGTLVIDEVIKRSMWGKWLVKKLKKEGEESTQKYLAGRARMCDQAKTIVEPKGGWRKQQQKKQTSQPVEKKTNQKAKKTAKPSEQQVNVSDNAGGVPTNIATFADKVPVAEGTATSEVKVTVPTRPTSDWKHGNNAATVSEAGRVPEMHAVPALSVTTRAAAKTAHASHDIKSPTIERPKAANTARAGDNIKNPTPKNPAAAITARACHDIKSPTTENPAAANAARAGHDIKSPAKTARAGHDVKSPPPEKPAASAIPDGDNRMSIDMQIYVESAILRWRWSKLKSQILHPGREVNGSRVRQAIERGRRLAVNTEKFVAKWRTELARGEEALKNREGLSNKKTSSTRAKAWRIANNTQAVDVWKTNLDDKVTKATPPAGGGVEGATGKASHAPKTGAKYEAGPNTTASSDDVQTPKSNNRDAANTSRDGDAIRPATDATTHGDDATVEAKSSMLAMCGHFGEDTGGVINTGHRDDVTDGKIVDVSTGRYISPYRHEYDWIFGKPWYDERLI